MGGSAARVLLRHGQILAAGRADATAMLVQGATIGWIGTESDAPADVDISIDLGGRLVTPGFVDAHVHLAKTGLALQSCDLHSARSLADALERLAEAASRAPDDLVLAHGWDDAGWPERRPFTGTELAVAVGGRPAYASRVDAHSAVVTDALVAMAGPVAAAPGWRADGAVEREAHHLVRQAVDALQTPERRRATLRLALDAVAAAGVTSVHDLNAPHISPADDAALIAELAAERPGPEVISYWGALRGGELAASPGLAGFAGDLCIDGSLGSHTAAVVGGYADRPDHAGHLYLDADAVADHVVWCTEREHQAGFHVIGDRALAALEQGLRAAADKLGDDSIRAARHRVEHVEMPSPALLEVLARLGVVASVQPAFDAAWGHPGAMYETRVGSVRAQAMNPFGSMRRAGVTLAFGSDSPVTPVDPWAGVRAAVSHHNPDERLTAWSAFEAHSVGGHRARGDDSAGRLAEGADATFAVWALPPGVAGPSAAATLDLLTDSEPAAGSEGRAQRPRCDRTVRAGRVIYDSGVLSDDEELA